MKVIGLHGGALIGVAYRTSRRISPSTASAISTISTMPMSGFGASGPHSSFDDPFANRSSEAAPQNFQLYRCFFWSYTVMSLPKTFLSSCIIVWILNLFYYISRTCSFYTCFCISRCYLLSSPSQHMKFLYEKQYVHLLFESLLVLHVDISCSCG